jgi:hypothetical protein
VGSTITTAAHLETDKISGERFFRGRTTSSHERLFSNVNDFWEKKILPVKSGTFTVRTTNVPKDFSG